MSATLRKVVLTTTAVVAFAMNSLLCRAALASGLTDAVSYSTLRFFSAAAFLGLVAVWRRRSLDGERDVAWRSALVLFAYTIPFSVAYARIPTGIGALLLFGAVQMIMIGWAMRIRAHPTLAEWGGLGLSLAGLVVLTRPGLARPDPVGAGLMLVAGAAWGVYSLRGRVSRDPIAANALAFVFASVLGAAAGLVSFAAGLARLDTTGAVLAIASGALSTGLGYVVWYAVLPTLSATRAALVQLAVPPLASVAGVLFLGEALTARLLIASGLILGGIAVAIAGRTCNSGSVRL